VYRKGKSESKNFRETLAEELKKPEFKEEWEKLKQQKNLWMKKLKIRKYKKRRRLPLWGIFSVFAKDRRSSNMKNQVA